MKRAFLQLLALLTVPWAQARTLHVPAGYATIQAAIDAAANGDAILVEAGTYRERLRLKPAVTVRSAGDDGQGKLGLKRAEATVIDGGGIPAGNAGAAPGVAMAEGSVLDGFTVTNVGRYDEERWKAHWDTRGANQPHAHIGDFGTPGIGADGVNCRIVNCIVHHNGHTGIAIRGADGRETAAAVESNVCHRNMGGGIGVMHGAKGVIRGNTCFENLHAGIGHNGAHPLVENNTCHANVRAGIGVSEGACPTVRGNRCHRNRRAGIGIRTGGKTRPVIEENDCHQNGMAGIGIDEGAAPRLRNNRCFRNTLAGIGVRADARPMIERNECRENKAAGIGLEGCREGTAVVTGNRLIDNKLVAIAVNAGWTVEIAGNTISRRGGLPPMIMIFEGADATIAGNTITGNGVAGVRVAGTAAIADNTLDGLKPRRAGPPHFGVWALPGSRVTVSRNTFTSWRHALLATGATVTATGNTAADLAATAFVVREPAAPARLTGNTLLSADPTAPVVHVDGDRNELRDNVVKPE